jgi:tetratricopeptide (TPR) repeat protein
MQRASWRRGVTLAAALLLLGAGAAAAAPRVPAAETEVLARVRPAADPEARALRALAERLRAAPDDLAVALDLARRHLVIARASLDPRHVGYAEAALAPWIALPAPPPQVRVLRATMRQSRHEFPDALADLDVVLRDQPDEAQALLTRATVRLVTGDAAGSRRDCLALATRATALVAATCRAAVDSVTGRAASALDDLARALRPAALTDPPAVRAWALTLQGEILFRLGRAEAAEAPFQAALALDPADVYARAAHADLLLQTGRPQEARALVERDLAPDALLLRAALAARATQAPDADALLALLLDRMQEAAQRGDTTHLREAARVQLDLLAQPRRALELARRNFVIQREPADALLLLRAARAAGQAEAARPALEWLAATGAEDVAIRAAAAALR